MAKIAFIVLCHKDPAGVIAQAQQLTAAGDFIAIHFDVCAAKADFRAIKKALEDNPNVTFSKRRIKCGWGEWSLVRATLYALEAAVDAFPRASRFYMVSGDCMSIKFARYAHDFLDADDKDYIAPFDYFESDSIKMGWKEERLIYRHFFNERQQKWLFYKCFEAQRALGLARSVPDDLQVQIGSQWWCLRRRTVEWVLDFTRERRDVMRFFKTTWIPDETFFQTIVRHVVPDREIECRPLTFLLFTDYGMPTTFHNDHYDLLLRQDFLFAGKISPDATDLKARLGALYVDDTAEFQVSDEGRNLFQFLSKRGRIGRRFAPRFWETESSLGRNRELMIIACKKWHVAKRLLRRIAAETDVPTIAYLFKENDVALPDLGGIQKTLDKRMRHCRALMRMLFEHYDTERLDVCLDPASIELLDDFYADRSTTKLLELEFEFSDDYLRGHAQRVGLAGADTSDDTMKTLLPTNRYDVTFESEQINDRGYPNHFKFAQDQSTQKNADALAAFLGIPMADAAKIAETEHFFVD
jgi:hypothetical protein